MKNTHTESGKILHLTTHATTKWEKFSIFNNFFLLQVEVEKNRKLDQVEVRNTYNLFSVLNDLFSI